MLLSLTPELGLFCYHVIELQCPALGRNGGFPRHGGFSKQFCLTLTPCINKSISMRPFVLGCIPGKTLTGGTPVIPQVYANIEGWRTPEVQRSKDLCVEVCILLRQYAKDYTLGYTHAAAPTGKLTQRDLRA